ncbi:uncharacterized protein PFLUO_LOCUS6365 [Penicillium psychrofluorescens]|uniref:uncharacterized protein n=1 Tax=Penicillium psychrofluorescens TaxID=3158075 RepID=UPI003CCDBF87
MSSVSGPPDGLPGSDLEHVKWYGTLNSAPDTPSPLYPERLIRPLPKRTLRSRLSTDTADTILYPPSLPVSQIFYGVSPDTEEVVNNSKAYARLRQTQSVDGCAESHQSHQHYDCEVAAELDSGDEDGPVVVRRSAGFRGSSPSPSSTHPNTNGDGPQVKSPAGPDGYDAFENTNNKKKRKIPTPGNSGGHHSALSPEFASMGLAAPNSSSAAAVNDGVATGTYYGSGNPASPLGSGISGSGRGRLGRSTVRSGSGRGPLSANAQNAWMNTRVPSRRDGLMSSPGPPDDSPTDQGIISTAIANAATRSSPLRGPSNVSLLDQENTTPTKTQFTFTCESDSSKGMAMQRNSHSGPHRSPTSPLAAASHNARGFSTQGTQTSPSMATQMNQHGSPGTQIPSGQGEEQAPVGRKKKRPPGAIYSLAARQRKIQQQYTNLHHPPAMEDIWICEFCEYESIFGRRPEALIRQYEIKDRKERKRLAEKKRLLEKAKMKGRKTKKATKNASKQAAVHQVEEEAYREGYRAGLAGESPGHPSDEEEDYEDEGDLIPAPASMPPAPADIKPPLPTGNHPGTTGTDPPGIADAAASRPA